MDYWKLMSLKPCKFKKKLKTLTVHDLQCLAEWYCNTSQRLFNNIPTKSHNNNIIIIIKYIIDNLDKKIYFGLCKNPSNILNLNFSAKGYIAKDEYIYGQLEYCYPTYKEYFKCINIIP